MNSKFERKRIGIWGIDKPGEPSGYVEVWKDSPFSYGLYMHGELKFSVDVKDGDNTLYIISNLCHTASSISRHPEHLDEWLRFYKALNAGN